MRWVRLIPAISVFACSLGYSDDIYLRTGFVFRHVQVIDTTNGILRFTRGSLASTVPLKDVTKVDLLPVQLGQGSKYEMYSQQLADTYQATAEKSQEVITTAASPSPKLLWSIILDSEDTLAECALLSLANDSLTCEQNGSIKPIAIQSIRAISRSHPSRFWVGAIAGTLAGAATGAVIGGSYSGGWIDVTGIGAGIGSGAGFLLGGLAGSLLGYEELYDFSGQRATERRQHLESLTTSH